MVSAAKKTGDFVVRKPQQKQGRFPVPIGGLNYSESLLTMPLTEAVLLDNMITRPFGVEVRKGWKYHVPQANKFANEVRTLMGYNSQVPSRSRLFASTADAAGTVYNVTTPNAAPVLSLTPSTVPVVPGEWYYVNYVTPGGNFLCMVSQGAGYYVYDGSGAGLWTEYVTGSGAGKIEFPAGDTTTTKQFVFCFTWKNRLWFLKDDSATAYYLPVSSISGKVTAFDLGPQLVHGGAMNFASTWTYDSGSGIDDGLVFASEEGDILVYQGTDPASASTFALKGTWYTGRFPLGRRCFTPLGGDIIYLTEYGVLRISDLVSGKLHTAALGAANDPMHKINPRLARLVSAIAGFNYWFVTTYPSEELLIVGSPFINPNTNVRQSFIMNSVTNAWSTVSQMDMLCSETYNGNFYFGTRDGYVMQGFVGFHDGTSSDGITLGSEVTGRIQSAFNDFGDPTINKRLLRVKIYGIADGRPSIVVDFVREYNITTLLSAGASTPGVRSSWDLAKWDEDIWDATSGSLARWIGVSGFGKKLALLLAIRGQSAVLLSDYEVLYETGINL